MNILFVDRNTKTGGGCRYLQTLVPHLRADGHRCYLMAGGGDFAHIVHPLFDDRVWHPPLRFWAGWTARGVLNKWDIDVVITQTVADATHVVTPCRDADVALIMMVHNCTDVRRASAAVEYSSAVVTMNTVTADYVASQSDTITDRVYLSRLPVNPRRFHPVPPRSDGGFCVLYCARLSRTKGPHAIATIDAARRLADDIPGFRLVIVGGRGRRLRTARRRAKETNTKLKRDAVQCVGRTLAPHPHMADADVVMGAGYVALEALSTNRRVIGIGFEGLFGEVTPDNFRPAMAANFGDTVAVNRDVTAATVGKAIQRAYRHHRAQGQIQWGHKMVSRWCDPQAIAESLVDLYRAAIRGATG